MAVAERGDRDAAREVDVHAPVLVPHARAFAAHRHERRGRVAAAPSARSNIARVTGSVAALAGTDAASRRAVAATIAWRRTSGFIVGHLVGGVSGRARRRRPGSRPGSRGWRASPRRSRAPASGPRTTHASHTAFIAAKSAMSGRKIVADRMLRLVAADFGQQAVDRAPAPAASAPVMSAFAVVGDLAGEVDEALAAAA